MKIANPWLAFAVMALLMMQAAQIFTIIRQESLTFDEGDHIFAGYMMWKTSDYGLNPEHPPLVKLLATSTILGDHLWIPPLQGRDFKAEAYSDGRDFLAANDRDHHLLLRMRVMAGILAIGMTLTIFFVALEWFGPGAALIALIIAVFDPNLLAHSALVTTDMAVSFFLLLSIFAFYRWANNPTLLRLVLAGLAAGCLIGSKHSGILLAPMLIALALLEIFRAAKGNRLHTALRMMGGLAAIVLIALTVLWSLYGFRYAARPPGLALSTPLANYMASLSASDRWAIGAFARWHLLPESYLMGLVDVRLVARDSSAFLLGSIHAHGVWWYFPVAILIKTTLGLLILIALAGFAIFARKLKRGREIGYLLLPGAIYLAVAMASGLNIGARHVLPLYALAAVLAGAGAWALVAGNRRWAVVVGLLLAGHIASALGVFPFDMAYANEAWGGPTKLHRYLSDASVDWAQQLVQVKQWQDRHPNEECWFAYAARPEIDPAMYGVHCHAMPTIDTSWMGGAEVIPPVIRGYVLLSGDDWSGCEWPSRQFNPYTKFQTIQESEQIDYGVMVYHGEFAVPEVAALSLVQNATALGYEGKLKEAVESASRAVALWPGGLDALTELGDSETAAGDKAAAKAAYTRAIQAAQSLEPDAQAGPMSVLKSKLSKL